MTRPLPEHILASLRYISASIRKRRWDLGWTQDDLASASGLSRNTVRQIEKGDIAPRPATAKKIADALGFVVSEIIDDEDDPVEKVNLLVEIVKEEKGKDKGNRTGATGPIAV